MIETNIMKKIKPFQELDLCDDFLFTEVMRDKDICKMVVERILNVKINRIEFLEPHVTRNPIYGAHGIEMDIYLEDGEDRVFTVEMQAFNEYNTRKRSRYIHSIVDADALLRTGDRYTDLKRNYVIFICTFDEFGAGRHIYTFEGRCVQDESLRLGDGSYTVFLNTEGTMKDVDEEMVAFLRYIKESSDAMATRAGSVFVEQIHRRVQAIKADQKEGAKYMKFEELMQRQHEKGYTEGLERGRDVGISEGKERGRQEIARAMKADGDAEERIMRITGMTSEEIEKL